MLLINTGAQTTLSLKTVLSEKTVHPAVGG